MSTTPKLGNCNQEKGQSSAELNAFDTIKLHAKCSTGSLTNRERESRSRNVEACDCSFWVALLIPILSPSSASFGQECKMRNFRFSTIFCQLH
ncbi:hypothetical protein RJ641_033365, partial [Dillenia turbinata]